jgi:hypothetical protein
MFAPCVLVLDQLDPLLDRVTEDGDRYTSPHARFPVSWDDLQPNRHVLSPGGFRCYTGGMRHRGRVAARLALALSLGAGVLLTGCPAGDGSGGCAPSADVRPTPTPVRTDPQPATSLRAAVDLTAGAGGGRAIPVAAVGRADGGAHVLLDRSSATPVVVTVTGVGAGFAVTGSVVLPPLDPTGDLHLLPGGRVLVPGLLAGRVWGFAVVDPAAGTARDAAVVPAGGTTHGGSVLSRNGRTVHLLLTGPGAARLAAVDAASGRLLGARDLTADVEPRTGPVRLLARPDGGVALVVDAGVAGCAVPTVLRYDEALEADGPPLPLATPGERARTRAVATTPDGAIFVSTWVGPGTWLLAVPAVGATVPTRVLTWAGHAYADALVVHPWQAWVLRPSSSGAEAVNLVTGGVTGIDVGCSSTGRVRELVAAPGGALLLGRCDWPAPGTPMLWITAP